MLILIMSISVVFDIAENLDRFLDQSATLKEIVFEHYVNFVLFYGNKFSGFIIFLAVIFFTSKMARDTEIVPILSGGISYFRFLKPYFIAASLLVVISLGMNHFIVPNANAKRLQFEEKYNSKYFSVLNQHKEFGHGTSVYFKSYYETRTYIDDFWMTTRDPKTGKLISLLYAQQAFGDSTSNEWTLKRPFIRVFDGSDLKHKYYSAPLIDTTFNFTLEDFTRGKNAAMTLTTPELIEFIKSEEKTGSRNMAFHKIELHERTSFSVVTYVLVLIGVSISSRSGRNTLGINLVLGILVAILYFFANRFAVVGAYNAGFNPFWAVWVPNLIFLGIGVLLLRLAPK